MGGLSAIQIDDYIELVTATLTREPLCIIMDKLVQIRTRMREKLDWATGHCEGLSVETFEGTGRRAAWQDSKHGVVPRGTALFQNGKLTPHNVEWITNDYENSK